MNPRKRRVMIMSSWLGEALSAGIRPMFPLPSESTYAHRGDQGRTEINWGKRREAWVGMGPRWTGLNLTGQY